MTLGLPARSKTDIVDKAQRQVNDFDAKYGAKDVQKTVVIPAELLGMEASHREAPKPRKMHIDQKDLSEM